MVIPFIALSVAISSLNVLVGLGITFRKMTYLFTLVAFSSFLFHTLLAGILIQLWDLIGAGIARCSTAAFGVVLTNFLGRRLGGPKSEWNRISAIFALSLLIYAFGYLIGMTGGILSTTSRLALVFSFPILLFCSPILRNDERQRLVSISKEGFDRLREEGI